MFQKNNDLKNKREEDIKNSISSHIRPIPWKKEQGGLKNFFVVDLIFICLSVITFNKNLTSKFIIPTNVFLDINENPTKFGYTKRKLLI